MTMDSDQREICIPAVDEDDDEEDLRLEDTVRFHPGDLIEVFYTDENLGGVSAWREAVVTKYNEFETFNNRVHFLFDDAEDQWIDVNDKDKIAPYGTNCFTPGSSMKDVRAGQLVDVVNCHPAKMTFMCGQVMKLLGGGKVEVKLLCEENRIVAHVCMLKPFCSRVRPETHKDNICRAQFAESRHRGESKLSGGKATLTTRSRSRGIGAVGDPRFSRYKEALARHGLQLIEMEGDGNCLFRAVSHQVYGSSEYHGLVREKCMDYMESESAYFQPFVVGDFGDYISKKRQHGVWGDDIEIQAMCEIYDRAAEVWAFDSRDGAKQLRTFHETDHGRSRSPMRLSFYGGGHYDSIVGYNFSQTTRSEDSVGALENRRVALSRARRSGITEEALNSRLSLAEASEQDMLDNAIEASRQQYMQSNNDLESVLEASLLEYQMQENAVLQQSLVSGDIAQEAQKALNDSDIAATDQERLEQALRMSKVVDSGFNEESQLHRAMLLSESKSEDEQLKEALRLSQESSHVGSMSVDDEEKQLQEALRLSQAEGMNLVLDNERMEMEKAMKMSEMELTSSLSSSKVCDEDDEEKQLQEALRLSQTEGMDLALDNERMEMEKAMKMSEMETASSLSSSKVCDEDDEEIQRAIAESIQSSQCK
uniref:ubiquitinyl hydrolase 1 n=1 Tax=Mucochytrium quahogii TaxID=96639 RepID=A0A7S2RLR0_9STRA|mmetsp:Transcript_17064/g.37246  ORF Transcript_17064/g.37246 Transcript_17064/m.37246 type:complete len:651 (+) Transcript_17064:274-2226(+)|eukprot:CAMPEP_0203792848 /NCGR_PEP_ID=MMETSP0100_2-20121128/5504_1 /ASSEMBLY_ACC=CAM_ASM_000210 /TAXON_ID=96639 /ORGANISM=" , Strain NY0313808BC1" /LENGTH=650 /DNA_ID=CAMNT_0050696495 /DNA_START=174 /DNA_END=2126 /DNA_ORIENTATION=-